jgi:hypothetical protein
LFYRGGIRGIVELEVLQAIQRYLGGRIPIRCFFDLIVGTRSRPLFFEVYEADSFLALEVL